MAGYSRLFYFMLIHGSNISNQSLIPFSLQSSRSVDVDGRLQDGFSSSSKWIHEWIHATRIGEGRRAVYSATGMERGKNLLNWGFDDGIYSVACFDSDSGMRFLKIRECKNVLSVDWCFSLIVNDINCCVINRPWRFCKMRNISNSDQGAVREMAAPATRPSRSASRPHGGIRFLYILILTINDLLITKETSSLNTIMIGSCRKMINCSQTIYWGVEGDSGAAVACELTL